MITLLSSSGAILTAKKPVLCGTAGEIEGRHTVSLAAHTHASHKARKKRTGRAETRRHPEPRTDASNEAHRRQDRLHERHGCGMDKRGELGQEQQGDDIVNDSRSRDDEIPCRRVKDLEGWGWMRAGSCLSATHDACGGAETAGAPGGKAAGMAWSAAAARLALLQNR